MKKTLIQFMTITILVICPLITTALDTNTGVIVDNSVRVRSEPGLSGKILNVLNTGDVVDILAQGDKLDQIDQDRCFKYYWYRVQRGKITGWVYGQYLYQFNPASENSTFDVLINTEPFQFAVFEEQGYEEDMPDNDRYFYPCFYHKEKNKAYPILWMSPVNTALLIPDDGKRVDSDYFRLIANVGGHEYIANQEPVITQDLGPLLIELKVNFATQDGGGSCFMQIQAERETFRLVGITETASSVE